MVGRSANERTAEGEQAKVSSPARGATLQRANQSS